MRALLLAAVSLIPLFSQIPQPADSAAAVRRLLEEQQQAWNRHDLEGFMSGYWNSPDLTFFSGAQQTAGWQGAIDRYRKNYQQAGKEMGRLEFRDLTIEPLGNEAAFVRGSYHLTMSDGKTPHGLFTLIFRKFPAGWKIVHDHTSAAE
jgi:beta-aspartyl-peptidase (threonine type)